MYLYIHCAENYKALYMLAKDSSNIVRKEKMVTRICILWLLVIVHHSQAVMDSSGRFHTKNYTLYL